VPGEYTASVAQTTALRVIEITALQEASQQLLGEIPTEQLPEPRQSQRSTTGKPPTRLADDPRYTGEESHLTIAQALASPAAYL